MRKKQNEIRPSESTDGQAHANGAGPAPAKVKAAAKPRAPKKIAAAAGAASDFTSRDLTSGDLTSESVIAANAMEHNGTMDLGPLAEAVAEREASNGREAVALRAYFRWLEKGCPAGSAEQDWLEAERAVQAV